MANINRATPLGNDADRFVEVSKNAVARMEMVHQAANQVGVLVSACIGPRYDPFAYIPPVSGGDVSATIESISACNLKRTLMSNGLTTD